MSVVDFTKYDLIWLGEIHGIRENYDAYMTFLPRLIDSGFRTILWEMPKDFLECPDYSQDGRVNMYSIELSKWLQSPSVHMRPAQLVIIGNREPAIIDGKSNYEYSLGQEIIDFIGGKKNTDKLIIISGNYHMKKDDNGVSGVKKSIEYLAEKMQTKILAVELKYAGGEYYNHGIQSFPHYTASKKYSGNTIELITTGNDYDEAVFHVGEAHAVFKGPTTLL